MQMGHTTTEMLFRVYSRFVPNLTRQDGSAFERLMLQNGTANPAGVNKNEDKTKVDSTKPELASAVHE
jgi:integrase